jgi:hypothetical protein
MFKHAWLAGLVGVLALPLSAPAHADVYTLQIYTGTCNGGSLACSAGTQNTSPTAGATFNNLVGTGAFTTSAPLSINLAIPTPQGSPGTIGDFLASGPGGAGAATGISAGVLGTNLSIPGVGQQTEFIFTGTLSGPANVSILHDDGIAFYVNGLLVSPVSAEGPTPAQLTTFSTATGGNFALYYVASNGNPSILDFQATVPIPATAWLFGGGLGGLMMLMRRRRKAGMAVA